ncbi:hypothetical protein V8C40DRAFT_241977 [Trichoderma camerunense]
MWYFEARSQLITRRRVTMQRRSKLAQENEMRIRLTGEEASHRCVCTCIGRSSA